MSEAELFNELHPAERSSSKKAFVTIFSGNLTPRQTHWASRAFSRFLDILVAFSGLLILFPMLLVLCLLLLGTQGGPVLIAHRRVGRNGASFACFKFRTMVKNGDELLAQHLASSPEIREEWEKNRKLRDDPRVTLLGRILRKNSIDEIPQLLNVIRGEMSLVGPRPITQAEVVLYGEHFADYIKVRPGITGLWQVSGRSETSYEERVAIDTKYVTERSVLGDLAIIAKTFPAVLSARGSY